MDDIKIRIPYVDEARSNDEENSLIKKCLSEVIGTDLSNIFDKTLYASYDSYISIMLAEKNKSQKCNMSFFKINSSKSYLTCCTLWYEFLLPILEPSKETFDNICKEMNRKSGIIELGYFPSTLVQDKTEIQRIKQSNKNYTGKFYTLPTDSYYVNNPFHKSEPITHRTARREDKTSSHPRRIVKQQTFSEYQIGDKRYITYRFEGDDIEYIFEVTPLKWHVDLNKQILICDTLPVNGIIFNDSYLRKINFSQSDISKYLNNCFLREAILNHFPKVLMKKEKLPISEELPVSKEKEEQLSLEDKHKLVKEIISLVNEISTYSAYYQGKEDINNMVRELIDQYNSDIDTINNSHGLQLYTEENLSIKLLIELTTLRDKLKKKAISKREYYDMLELINICQSILAGIDIDLDGINDELVNDILKISNEILPKLSTIPSVRDGIKDKLLNEFISDKDAINSYLRYLRTFDNETSLSLDNNLPYKTLEEYELNFRIRLHSILQKMVEISKSEEMKISIIENKNILDKVNGRNISLTTINSILQQILNSTYNNDYNDNTILHILFEEINNLVIRIREKGYNVEDAFNVNIEDSNIETIVNALETILKKLYVMENNIDENREKQIRLSKYKVSI